MNIIKYFFKVVGLKRMKQCKNTCQLKSAIEVTDGKHLKEQYSTLQYNTRHYTQENNDNPIENTTI